MKENEENTLLTDQQICLAMEELRVRERQGQESRRESGRAAAWRIYRPCISTSPPRETDQLVCPDTKLGRTRAHVPVTGGAFLAHER